MRSNTCNPAHILMLTLRAKVQYLQTSFQYLAVVVTPLEHPKYRYSYILWAVSWLFPVVLCAVLPASTATDIRYSYNRMTCTFNRWQTFRKYYYTLESILAARKIGHLNIKAKMFNSEVRVLIGWLDIIRQPANQNARFEVNHFVFMLRWPTFPAASIYIIIRYWNML